MKKLDKFIIKSFLGPFVLTFVVVVFILLTQYMLKYFDDFVGKDLGFEVFAELIFYFSISMTPNALPLAVLLSSLMTFGNMGEHFELTAIKGAGISLLRTLQPLFLLAAVISYLGFLSNNYIVPKVNLKAYSLLYDIKQTKPALDIQEGVFYGGIPGFEIKVNEKLPDGETLRDIMIYDHRNGLGNQEVTLADSGKMYTADNSRYLVFELFNGNRYSESKLTGNRSSSGDNEQFLRNSFSETKIRFSLASFDMQRTKEEFFSSHRRMKTIEQLSTDIDSLENEALAVQYDAFTSSTNFYTHHLKYDSLMPRMLKDRMQALSEQKTLQKDSLQDSMALEVSTRKEAYNGLSAQERAADRFRAAQTRNRERLYPVAVVQQNQMKIEKVDTALIAKVDSAVSQKYSNVISKALTQSRTIKNTLQVNAQKLKRLRVEVNQDEYEGKRKITQAVSCLLMFLIGAPLGAIIKRGGLGMPVLISVCFFIAFYVLTEISRKWSDELILDANIGVWFPNMVLLPFGIIFLLQARMDTRILEVDFYLVAIDKIKSKLKFFNRKIPV